MSELKIFGVSRLGLGEIRFIIAGGSVIGALESGKSKFLFKFLEGNLAFFEIFRLLSFSWGLKVS